ncbi:MAG: UPF0236 family protein [Anaerolineaceae bacterium]|jgi:hypothetical protein|nr:UPF0236 family protein [Anaerolineaceae bacterium]NLC29925.1 hypothetical protein [Chloroflexota bacterium]
MTELAVEIIIQVKLGEFSKVITEFIPINALMAGVNKLEQGCQQAIASTVLEVTERSIHSQIPKSWKNLGTAKRSVLTESGLICFKRHIYEDDEKQRQKPLDELLNVQPYERNSKKVEAMIASLATEISYRQTANLSGYILNDPISASTVGRICERVGEKIQAMESHEIFEEPVMGACSADVLYCETDGVYIHLQGERQKKTEVKVGMFYTGKSWIGQNRYRCTDKLTTCQLGLSSSAWQNHLRELAYRNYDFDRIRLAVVGGDGAEWVRNSFEGLGKPTIHLLDRFHVVRCLKRGFGSVLDINELKMDLFSRGFGAIEKRLKDAIIPDACPFRDRQIESYKYLKTHQNILTDLDKRSLDGFEFSNLGSMEGNVDKLVRQRMKGRGMSWSIRGARSLLAVIRHKELIKSQAFAQIGHVEVRTLPRAKAPKKTAPEWVANTYSIPVFRISAESNTWVQLLKSRLNDSLSINTFF